MASSSERLWGRVDSSPELIDLLESRADARALRWEIGIFGVALVVVALIYRYTWIHVSWQAPLERIHDVVGLPVQGVGRWFSAWAAGDGQTFAIMASDPLGLDEGLHITQPVYRYLRVGFAWLVWMTSLGQEQWIPYAMATVGALGIIGTFLLAVRLRPALGLRAWLLVFNPALVIGFAGDTAEAAGVFVLVWAMATGSRWSSVALGVIRPSYLVALVGRHQLPLWGLVTAGMMALLWCLRFGLDMDQFAPIFGPPFLGYIVELSVQSLVLLCVAVLTLTQGLRYRDWAWVASGAMVVCFAAPVVESAANGWRAAGMLFVLWAFGRNYLPQGGQRIDSSHRIIDLTGESPSVLVNT